MYYCRINISYFVLYILLFTVSVTYGQDQDFEKVQIKTVKAAGNVYMLLGSGGNIGVCVGDDGVFLVDDQFAPLTEKIKGAIEEISDKDVRFVINAAKNVLSIINDDTEVIPGHGPLSNKAELTAYVDMLTGLRDKISKHILEGKTLDEILALKPTQEFDEKWGHGFLAPDQFVQILYEDLSGYRK